MPDIPILTKYMVRAEATCPVCGQERQPLDADATFTTPGSGFHLKRWCTTPDCPGAFEMHFSVTARKRQE